MLVPFIPFRTEIHDHVLQQENKIFFWGVYILRLAFVIWRYLQLEYLGIIDFKEIFTGKIHGFDFANFFISGLSGIMAGRPNIQVEVRVQTPIFLGVGGGVNLRCLA